MLKGDLSGLDYYRLLKEAKRLPPSQGPALRLGLLADVSTQYMLPLLRVLFARNGAPVEIYEAGFDTVKLESYNPASGLYQFRPEVVVILQGIDKLKSIYYGFSGDRTSFAKLQAEEIETTWRTIQKQAQVPIIQTNFVIPYERAFGNFSLQVAGSLTDAVLEINREIRMRARTFQSVFISDLNELASWVGRHDFLDEKLWLLAKSLCALEFLPHIAQNITDIALACVGRAVKCVVLDLDNTLWGGVVAEDGMDGIVLGDQDEGSAFRSFQLYLRELSRRGILLAVCSKNDEAVVRRVFREHPGMVLRESDISAFVANWEDKAANITKIREELNIGFDSMVFLDDNSFERNLVRSLIPDIIVPELPEDPALYTRTLSELNLFETTSYSVLDRQRTALYQDQRKREAETRSFGNLTDYLRSLETIAEFSPFEPRNLSRIAQLIQRSNQFNLTTHRYSESQCEAIMRNTEQYFAFTISIRDRFGDFGLILVAILRRLDKELEIDSFLMSCRVLQRGVEQFAMNKVFAYAREGGVERVIGRYVPSAKNGIVQSFFEQFGFTKETDQNPGATKWSLEVKRYVPVEVFIRESSEGAVGNSIL